MKRLIVIFVFFFCGSLAGQQLDGAWKLIHQNGNEVTEQEIVKIYQDGYFAFGAKEVGSNKFIKAGGGEFSLEDNYVESYDFYTENPELVGTEKEYRFQLEDDRLVISNAGKTEVWQRIPDKEDELSGNWVITGRKRNGELNTMTPGDRRTIKILGGGRFQWAAFNSKTKEFHGTGGGTYSAENGKYTENIKFFSRDDSRVGADLQFNYEVKNGQWHHSGLSSKGDPIYEIWSLYKEAYQE